MWAVPNIVREMKHRQQKSLFTAFYKISPSNSSALVHLGEPAFRTFKKRVFK